MREQIYTQKSLSGTMYPDLISSGAIEAGSNVGKIVSTAHGASAGDVFFATSGCNQGLSCPIKKVISADEFVLTFSLPFDVTPGDTFNIVRLTFPLIGADGSMTVSAGDGFAQAVHEDDDIDGSTDLLPAAVKDGSGKAKPLAQPTTPSDTQPISAASLPLPTGAATSANQTNGSQKSIVRGGAKGTTTAADVTSTASSVDRQGLDVVLYDGAGRELDFRMDNENWNAADHGVLVFGRDIDSTPNKYRAIALNTEGDVFVDLSDINGVEPLVGNGATGAGSLRVTTASDSPDVTNLAAIKTAVELIDNVVNSINGPGAPTIDSYTKVAINLAAGANQVLVSAPGANKQIWIYGFGFSVNVAGTVSFQDEDDTALSGIMQIGDKGGMVSAPSGNFAMPIWKLATNKALEVDVVTSELDGWLCYAIVSV